MILNRLFKKTFEPTAGNLQVGSCSRRGTVSLNWRLIQTPSFVRDYIILHELAHRRHMNHSNKFWQEVKRLCPDYLLAERWLKQNAKLLRKLRF